jgi:hypothetical protein
MHLKEGEERTAGSDPGIRFSFGGPISLDQELENIFFYYICLKHKLKRNNALREGVGGGIGVGGVTIYSTVAEAYTTQPNSKASSRVLYMYFSCMAG